MFEYVTVYGKLMTEQGLKKGNIVSIEIWHGMNKIDCPFVVKSATNVGNICYVDLAETEIIRGKIKK